MQQLTVRNANCHQFIIGVQASHEEKRAVAGEGAAMASTTKHIASTHASPMSIDIAATSKHDENDTTKTIPVIANKRVVGERTD